MTAAARSRRRTRRRCSTPCTLAAPHRAVCAAHRRRALGAPRPRGARCIWSAISSPTTDALAVDEITLVVQVNGKMRARISARRRRSAKTQAFALALDEPNVRAHLDGKERAQARSTFPANCSTWSHERSATQSRPSVCIVGGGPCGMMLGVLLARAGVDVTVLEKYPGFLPRLSRRHDPPVDAGAALRAGLARRVSRAAAQRVVDRRREHRGRNRRDRRLLASADALQVRRVDAAVGLSQLPRGARQTLSDLPSADEDRGTGLIEDDGRVDRRRRAGRRTASVEIDAKLVVGADGRHSTIRDARGLRRREPRRADGRALDAHLQTSRRSDAAARHRSTTGHMLVMIDRGDYWQCAYSSPKARSTQLQEHRASKRCSDRARCKSCRALPTASPRSTIGRRFRCSKFASTAWSTGIGPGLLCIGDAAHAMSPIGGVGINLAIQDAVATANLLAGTARRGRYAERP